MGAAGYIEQVGCTVASGVAGKKALHQFEEAG